MRCPIIGSEGPHHYRACECEGTQCAFWNHKTDDCLIKGALVEYIYGKKGDLREGSSDWRYARQSSTLSSATE